MNLKEMDFERQVRYLRSLLSSGKNSLLGYFALFAFRHHLATKHSANFSRKPILRWYLGQLAKEYINKYFNEAKASLENFVEIGLLEGSMGTMGKMGLWCIHTCTKIFPVKFCKEHLKKE